MSQAARTALVTGSNGHLGGQLVRLLAERGWRVRAGVRDAADEHRTRGLPPGVEVVSLDVRDEPAFVRAARGADTVFHAAATFKTYVADAAEADGMLRDSLEGARASVAACAANGVRRLVLTSSTNALPLVEPGAPAVDESHWRTDFVVPYMRAKTLAEQQAWALARERGVGMVSVLPGGLLGPGFRRGTATTNLIESIMLGAMRLGVPDANLAFVDVRDAAEAHLLAAEPPAHGRYIACYDQQPSLLDLVRMLHRIDPTIPLPLLTLPDVLLPATPLFDWLNHKVLGAPRTFQADMVKAVRGKVWAISNQRARRELGWQPRVPIEQSLADTLATLHGLRAGRAALGDAAAVKS